MEPGANEVALANAAASGAREAGRLLTFEVDGHIYALPIVGILEVAEAGSVCGVPTLPRSLAGVMNWNGEALPIVATRLVVTRPEEGATHAEADEEIDTAQRFGATAEPLDAEHVLVVSDRGGEIARLGLPIDSVLGLVDATGNASSGSAGRADGHVVVERRSVDGRVVSVLDPRRVVARANDVIERLAA